MGGGLVLLCRVAEIGQNKQNLQWFFGSFCSLSKPSLSFFSLEDRLGGKKIMVMRMGRSILGAKSF